MKNEKEKKEKQIFLEFAAKQLLPDSSSSTEGVCFADLLTELTFGRTNYEPTLKSLFNGISKLDISLIRKDQIMHYYSIVQSFSGEWGLILSNTPSSSYPFELGIICFKTEKYYGFHIPCPTSEWKEFKAQFPLERS